MILIEKLGVVTYPDPEQKSKVCFLVSSMQNILFGYPPIIKFHIGAILMGLNLNRLHKKLEI